MVIGAAIAIQDAGRAIAFGPLSVSMAGFGMAEVPGGSSCPKRPPDKHRTPNAEGIHPPTIQNAIALRMPAQPLLPKG